MLLESSLKALLKHPDFIFSEVLDIHWVFFGFCCQKPHKEGFKYKHNVNNCLGKNMVCSNLSLNEDFEWTFERKRVFSLNLVDLVVKRTFEHVQCAGLFFYSYSCL